MFQIGNIILFIESILVRKCTQLFELGSSKEKPSLLSTSVALLWAEDSVPFDFLKLRFENIAYCTIFKKN